MRTVFQVVQWACMAFALVVFLGQLAMVLMRYLLGFGFLEMQDAVNYAFAALAALAVAVAFEENKHVRVDVFSQRLSEAVNGWIDSAGDLLLALPVFAILLWTAFPLIRASWAIFEGSPETGGLPGLFLVKSVLLLLPGLVLLLVLTRLASALRRGLQ
ncbi:TRAP transporter small permease subunit [Roseibium denhamense]|nr:TRAP transporter small permease subunit [Roseibium denhamense]